MTKSKIIDPETVLSQLTYHEKIKLTSGLDCWHTYPIPRLNVTSIRISDAPNGIRGTKFFNAVPTTCIPTGTALASTWNTTLVRKLGCILGEQAHAKGAHAFMGPNINLARSPIGGRSFETLGEDPFLAGWLAVAYCEGVHSQKIVSCPKHIVCNDKDDFRMTMNVDISERALREVYLMPFMLVQKYTKPTLYMTAYNKVNGITCSENPHILQDIVTDEWKFDGCFVSDWFGTVSCAESINAGMHLEMPGPPIWRGKLLEMSVFHNTVKMEALDKAVLGVLRLVSKAQESGIPENAPEVSKDDAATTAVVRQAAREAIVLLKNEDNLLPIKKSKVLLVGEAAKFANFSSGGSTALTPNRSVSLLDALSEELGAENVDWVLGSPNRAQFPSFSLYAKGPNSVRYCVYDDPRSVAKRVPLEEEYVDSIDAFIGDFDPARLRNPDKLYASFQVDIKVPESGYYKVNLKVSGWAELYINGESKILNDLVHPASGAFGLDAPEIEKDIYFEAGKPYNVEVEFESTLESSFITGYGCVSCGILKPFDIPAAISEAAEKAKNAEQVIVVTGFNKDFECEGIDRKTMDLPPHQDDLIEAVLEANPNAVVVLETGTPTNMRWNERAKAIVHGGYLGEELGHGLADVLLGKFNPCGKLPFTWPKQYEDVACSTSFQLDNDYSLAYSEDVFVGYRHFDARKIEPLYPFGFGLSYSDFKITKLDVTKKNDEIKISVSVANNGDYNGSEVVQVYVSNSSAPVPVPVKELKGFTKVEVNKRSSKNATITLPLKITTSFYNTKLKTWTMNAGKYIILVGTSSRDIHLQKELIIDETVNWIDLE